MCRICESSRLGSFCNFTCFKCSYHILGEEMDGCFILFSTTFGFLYYFKLDQTSIQFALVVVGLHEMVPFHASIQLDAWCKSLPLLVSQRSFNLSHSLEILAIVRFSLLHFTFWCFQCSSAVYPAKGSRP